MMTAMSDTLSASAEKMPLVRMTRFATPTVHAGTSREFRPRPSTMPTCDTTTDLTFYDCQLRKSQSDLTLVGWHWVVRLFSWERIVSGQFMCSRHRIGWAFIPCQIETRLPIVPLVSPCFRFRKVLPTAT